MNSPGGVKTDKQEPLRLDEQPASVLFMLEEYKHLSESFRNNEERGQHQVTLFLTLVAIVVTALASGRLYLWIWGAAVGAVLLVGIITLMRLIKRNIQSDEYLRGLGGIRRYFISKEAELVSYIPYPPREDSPMRQKRWRDVLSFSDIGLVETVQLLNSLAFAALVTFVVRGFVPALRFRYLVALLLAGFAVAWTIQFVFIKWRYGRVKRDYEKRRR